jgi:hypothetical protein
LSIVFAVSRLHQLLPTTSATTRGDTIQPVWSDFVLLYTSTCVLDL